MKRRESRFPEETELVACVMKRRASRFPEQTELVACVMNQRESGISWLTGAGVIVYPELLSHEKKKIERGEINTDSTSANLRSSK